MDRIVTALTFQCIPLCNDRTNWSSALLYLTDGESEDHLEMLDGAVIKQLLDEKWKVNTQLKFSVQLSQATHPPQTFAQRRFFLQLFGAVCHLVFLSTALYLRPSTSFLGMKCIVTQVMLHVAMWRQSPAVARSTLPQWGARPGTSCATCASCWRCSTPSSASSCSSPSCARRFARTRTRRTG